MSVDHVTGGWRLTGQWRINRCSRLPEVVRFLNNKMSETRRVVCVKFIPNAAENREDNGT